MRRPCYLVLSIAWISGCGAESNPAPEPPPADSPPPFDHPDPTPYEPEFENTALTPTLSSEDVAELVPEVLSLAGSTEAQTLIAAFRSLDALNDDTCPSGRSEGAVIGGEGSVVLWINEQACTSESGVYFGPGVAQSTSFTMTIQDGIIQQNDQVFTQYLDLQGPDGTWVRGGFLVDRSVYTLPNDGGTFYTLFYQGSARVDPSTAAENLWLNGEITADFAMEAGEFGEVRTFKIYGSIRPPGDHPLSAVDFGDFSTDNFGCGRTFGRISLRDSFGGWHDTDFGSELDAGSHCDACGDLVFRDDALGTVCLDQTDLGALLAWETTPW